MDGFLLINKPKGLTSHDVVFKIKKKLHVDKIGHTGTLDPFACGLLILCLGKATKLAYMFSDLDKAYEGTIVFGKHYDTYDTTGQIMDEKEPLFNEEDLKNAMDSLKGRYQQLPPMYSAIKVDGQKLYQLARKGLDVERDTREVQIYEFDMKSKLSTNQFGFYTSVSKGTYIRSLAVDLAKKLNTFAALSSLNRLSIGNYHLKDAKTIENVAPEHLISLNDYFKTYPKIALNDYMIKLVKNGVYLDERQTTINKPFIVIDEHNQMIAFYDVIGLNKYKPMLIF
ncbi:tRNA pseudouridine(55) synthase TruB [Peloplasma aerotolerans]|uniref:tRNA pseudouridine synthase B n=1 Tax=Peloplasma aerotolerans TaxID=3044389 RepID=A0AAW6U2C5_9MOLU|nr:tRNA pseudouridine(55) synthase TruB [Mariniplasma sp. M4Ah]MDI6452027.1 tRNA pseudouridine(55) synthase TruB [Mariniplasma sp. M4Ah]MDR4968276.1 tRNA pseudouridine(55) synthase TruB [Acholeplasmataceae bacterium]